MARSQTTLTPLLENTSTAKVGTNTANNLLTSIGFKLPDGISITGGSVFIGSDSQSINFDPAGSAAPQDFGAGKDVSVEWGFGNNGQFAQGDNATNFPNYISANQAGATPFQAVDATNPNLDGPDALDGPQAGLGNFDDFTELGYIFNSIRIVANLSGEIDIWRSWPTRSCLSSARISPSCRYRVLCRSCFPASV